MKTEVLSGNAIASEGGAQSGYVGSGQGNPASQSSQFDDSSLGQTPNYHSLFGSPNFKTNYSQTELFGGEFGYDSSEKIAALINNSSKMNPYCFSILELYRRSNNQSWWSRQFFKLKNDTNIKSTNIKGIIASSSPNHNQIAGLKYLMSLKCFTDVCVNYNDRDLFALFDMVHLINSRVILDSVGTLYSRHGRKSLKAQEFLSVLESMSTISVFFCFRIFAYIYTILHSHI